MLIHLCEKVVNFGLFFSEHFERNSLWKLAFGIVSLYCMAVILPLFAFNLATESGTVLKKLPFTVKSPLIC